MGTYSVGNVKESIAVGAIQLSFKHGYYSRQEVILVIGLDPLQKNLFKIPAAYFESWYTPLPTPHDMSLDDIIKRAIHRHDRKLAMRLIRVNKVAVSFKTEMRRSKYYFDIQLD